MRIATLVFLFLCASLPVFAQEEEASIVADRPGLADGAATVGDGVFQLEAGLTFDGAEGEESATLPSLLRIGFGPRFELRLESDVLALRDGDRELAPFAAGFKLRLTEGAVPLSLMGKVQPPSGEGTLRTTGFESEARIVSDIELGRGFAVTPNVGVAFVEGDDAIALFALSLEKNLGRALPFVDFETQLADGETSLIADAGIAWIVGRDTQLDISAGVDVAGDAYPEWFVSAGYSRRF